MVLLEDFLRAICTNSEIELMYTNNQKPILSSYLDFEGTRIIVAHNVFRGCTKDLAMAVVDYYTNENNREENLNKIKDYLNKFLNKYVIDDFVVDGKDKPKKEIKDEKKSSLMELEIKSIIPRSFKGRGSGVKDKTMMVGNDDVLELDIYVNHFDT